MRRMFNPEIETLTARKKEELQCERLKWTVTYCYDRVPHYRKKMDAAGVAPSDIVTLKDAQKLPFSTKDDLRDNYPYGLFATPMEDIVRVHASSGTTGKPVVAAYTKNDLAIWAELIARCLVMAGATNGSVIQNAYGYGLFTGGFGIHGGAELLGATIIPISGGNTKRQIMLLEDFKPDILTCTPSYALYIAETAKEAGVDFSKLNLRSGIFGAEPWSEDLRKTIEKAMHIKAFDIYGLTEVMGPGVGCECEAQAGLHIFDDHFYPEIIDADGNALPYGEKGELAFTSLTKEAFPLLRYRTKDITRIIPEPCACGRTHCRIERITGRVDDMLIIRGVNVFPTQIESVLMQIAEAEPHYQLIVRREGALDDLEVRVEVNERLFSDEVKRLEALQKRICAEIDSLLGISVRVKLVEPKTIARSEGKAKRVIDMRNT